MYKVSVSVLESFRRYINDVSDYDTEDKLLKSIQGIWEGNELTDFGGSFHKIIENPKIGIMQPASETFLVDNILFTPDQYNVAVNYHRAHPTMVHEIPLYKVYKLMNRADRMEIMVTLKLDGMEGKIISDAKCKFSKPQFDGYMNSFQWRFYLDVLRLSVFRYDIFEIKGYPSALPPGPPYHFPKVQIMPPESLLCYRYNNMDEDVLNLLSSFVDYIEMKDYWDKLKAAKAFGQTYGEI